MKFICTLFCSCLTIYTFAQDLFPEAGVVFNDEVIPRVDILIDADSLEILLDSDNVWDNHEYPATFIWNDSDAIDTLDNVGFRLRGNSSRVSAKKSFKVDFTKFGGKKFHGLAEMNLNGEHNDPSIIRSKLCWDLYKLAGVPSTRSNHVVVYINDEYRGLYINVEHIDKNYLKQRYADNSGNLYKCFWGADLTFISNDPDSYKLMPFGNRVYDLKTNRDEDDYSDLAHFIAALNNENDPDFRCELEAVFNVDTYLKAMVMDILTANWDGPIYNKNNFYLYSNPRTGKFEYIPYDLDNTFGIDWFQVDWARRNIYTWSHPDEARPLFENLLSVPEYRNRMSYYMDQFLEQFFNTGYLYPYLDDFKNRLSPHAQNDYYASLDYGYDLQDFLNSYEFGLGAHVPYGIKEYIDIRVDHALSQLDLQVINPILDQEQLSWDETQVVFFLRVVDEDLLSVTTHYNFDNQGWQSGNMRDDGMAPDQIADDGIFTLGISYPGFGTIDYFFEAYGSTADTERWPHCNEFRAKIGYEATPELYINEFMADNSTITDNVGEFEDWIEIYNAGATAVYLGDKYLSDNHQRRDKWEFPDITLKPGAFLLIWADEDQNQGELHANFKLNKSGEELGIWDSVNNNFAPIDTFTFGSVEANIAWGRYPDGEGPVVALEGPTPGYSNLLVATQELETGLARIIPNPVKEWLYVDFEELISAMEIWSVNGSMVQKIERSEKQRLIFAGSLTPGWYVLKIMGKNGKTIIPFVKI